MHSMGTIKCIGTVFLIGIALIWFGNKFMHYDDRCMRKKAKRAIRNMENIVDDIHYMFK